MAIGALILIIRVLLFRILKFLYEYFGINLCEPRVRENWSTLLLRGLEIGFAQSVVEMAVTWHRVEDITRLLGTAAASASADRGHWVALGTHMLVLQMRVERGIRKIRFLAEAALVISPLCILGAPNGLLADSALVIFILYVQIVGVSVFWLF